ncbi:hypothetical protein A6F53_09855 [Levilactobacillus brevis]|uniref:Wzz/FepE/Etk N-terminal domain-containing protein n=1 Tax=Levilactobacillus brevis TaxID=1580 RepID=UPI0007F8C685|nr:Wzz/FepE/Etk N-terminal domain-containing protein [Levilactobacillus brevis]ANN49529.1 hypothetical protein A6F53_09855 [Levilactobacillus brevis]
MESKFSFLPFVKVLWHRLFWIIICGVIGGFIGYKVTQHNFVPKYTVTSTINVRHKPSATASKQDTLNADISRLGTVQSQVGDNGIYYLASKRLKKQNSISLSTKEINKSIDVIAKPASTILEVVATSKSAKQASLMVNAVVYSYKEKYTKSDKSLMVTQLSKATEDWATTTKPAYTKPVKLWAAMGALIAYALFLLGYALRARRESQRKH